eukprot:TRINITY_DN12588_c0_g1_i1.p1 TRINITY_DN12588_c0_g1~~TRINITY_DN12588_c0_g1_i1.p1  ORF type:complete len:106 (+),score=28.37 TRINITY_DN12588_c0_g1_i1:59-376(+)
MAELGPGSPVFAITGGLTPILANAIRNQPLWKAPWRVPMWAFGGWMISKVFRGAIDASPSEYKNVAELKGRSREDLPEQYKQFEELMKRYQLMEHRQKEEHAKKQ